MLFIHVTDVRYRRTNKLYVRNTSTTCSLNRITIFMAYSTLLEVYLKWHKIYSSVSVAAKTSVRICVIDVQYHNALIVYDFAAAL